MAYCSRKCQVEDWKALHRLECSEMRKRYMGECCRCVNPPISTEQHHSILEGKSVRGYYTYRYRKYHANVIRACYETNEVVRRTVTYTQDKWNEYDPCGVCQSVIILPEDKDRAPGWVDKLDTYLERTAAQGAVPPYLQPRFNAFVGVFRKSIADARAKPFTPPRLRKGPGKFIIPNDSPGSIRFAERTLRWVGGREKVCVLLMEQIKEVPIFTAPIPLMAEAMALQATRQGTHGGPLFKIHASLVYEWYVGPSSMFRKSLANLLNLCRSPSRSFSSADLVTSGRLS